MENFLIEEQVPCTLPELKQERRRLRFKHTQVPVYLATDMRALPLIHGYRLSVFDGAFFVEDLKILQKLSSDGVVPITLNETDLLELEQYHAHGFLTPNPEQRATFTLFDSGEKYRHLYQGDNYTWFSMAPVTLEMDLTNLCNQTCVHCCRDSSPKQSRNNDLSSKELFGILDDAIDIGVDEISFLGGEPTLQPHILELAYFVRKKGVRTLNLATNGLEISDDHFEPFSVLFTTIQISLHGASPSKHDNFVRKQGAFKTVVENIKRFVACGANVSLACTVTESQPEELTKLVQLSRKLGVNEIRFIPLADQGRGSCLPSLAWRDYQEVGAFIEQTKRNGGDLKIGSGGFPAGQQQQASALFYGCSAGLTRLHLTSTGFATGCSLVENNALDSRNRPLLDVWHSEEMKKMRKRLQCDCAYVKQCAGGCLSVLNNNLDGKGSNHGGQKENGKTSRNQGESCSRKKTG